MKIFIVEDDRSVRELLCAFVSELGHEVTPTENGRELVELAMLTRPDLIMTDLHMPDIAGNSMIEMLDMYPPLIGIPVIVITGATPDELEDAGIAQDIPIILKPVDFAKLTAEINKVAQRLCGGGQNTD